MQHDESQSVPVGLGQLRDGLIQSHIRLVLVLQRGGGHEVVPQAGGQQRLAQVLEEGLETATHDVDVVDVGEVGHRLALAELLLQLAHLLLGAVRGTMAVI